MPNYIVTVRKRLTADLAVRWANTYRVVATGISQALDRAYDIGQIERAIHWDNVDFFQLHAMPVIHGGDGLTSNISWEGSLTPADPDEQLPLFNTVKVSLIADIGRPAIKYLRLPLTESEVLGFDITTAKKAGVDEDYAGPLQLLGYITNHTGSVINGTVISNHVTARQLGWHRRTRVGMKRGWVPKD